MQRCPTPTPRWCGTWRRITTPLHRATRQEHFSGSSSARRWRAGVWRPTYSRLRTRLTPLCLRRMPRTSLAMPLDPQVQAVLDKIREAGNPEYWQMTPQQARDWHNRKAGILDVKPEPVFQIGDRSIPGPAGAIPVRTFVPRQASEPLPVLVWLHGGGHVVGSL